MLTLNKTTLVAAVETIPVIKLAPPEPANKATLSPLMQRVIRNQQLAELVENHELA